MTPETASPTPRLAEPAPRARRTGRLIVAGVILLATAGAFGIARLTFDKTLSPLQRQARA